MRAPGWELSTFRAGSAPARLFTQHWRMRSLADRFGADVVVNLTSVSPYVRRLRQHQPDRLRWVAEQRFEELVSEQDTNGNQTTHN